MASARAESHSRWCIVVADSAGPDWPLSRDINADRAPVQYCGLGEPTTLLQRALHRAVRISHAARVMVTAAEAHRSYWQRALWFMRPENRFVSESPGWSLLTTAAAVLSIAARTPMALITILPARCYVADEWPLMIALHRVLSDRSGLADGIATLGMIAAEPGIDEDYLALSAADDRPTVAVAFSSQEHSEWVARDLVRRGAVIASGIYIGYARTLASVLYKYWPALTQTTLRHLKQSVHRGVEIRIPLTVAQEELRASSRPFWDHPPWMWLRALRVAHCGWSSLRSLRAIERIATLQLNQHHLLSTEPEYERLNHEHNT
jgi:mannose-1-phosphate guanylyltransferase